MSLLLLLTNNVSPLMTLKVVGNLVELENLLDLFLQTILSVLVPVEVGKITSQEITAPLPVPIGQRGSEAVSRFLMMN